MKPIDRILAAHAKEQARRPRNKKRTLTMKYTVEGITAEQALQIAAFIRGVIGPDKRKRKKP